MSFDPTTPATANLAATLADVLPKVQALGHFSDARAVRDTSGYEVVHYAVPRGADVKALTVDLEHLLPHPRRTKAAASFSDPASFLAYVQRHAIDGTAVWCRFNPQTFALDFTAVFDEHTKDHAGWRAHTALYAPDFSAEWKAWKGKDGSAFSQVDFAEWIEEHAEDITSKTEGMPTAGQMLKMATEFVANEERVFKSSVRLQSGGVRLTYIADPDAGTTQSMDLFQRFELGIPVFQAGGAWAMTARLKYRQRDGKLSFFYELERADRVHQAAANEQIQLVRAGLEAAGVPLFMGSVSSKA